MNRPSPHPGDPARIALLVDQFLAHEKAQAARPPNSPPAKTTPVPRVAAPTQTKVEPAPKTVAAPTPTTAPKKTNEGEKMLRRTKTKTTTKTTRKTPTRFKPRATIELAPQPEPSIPFDWGTNGAPTSRRATQSAHDAEPGVTTPCWTCGGECDETAESWGPWRRHVECLRITQPWQHLDASARSLGVLATQTEVRSARPIVWTYGGEHPSAVYLDGDDRRAWSHVQRADVARVIADARQQLADAEVPQECDLGWCAICGVSTSLTWTDAGHVRHDGTSAPLCSTCWPIFDRCPGSVAFYEDQRDVIAESITGTPPVMGDTYPGAMRAHGEVGGGDGEAWSHLPAKAVEAFRWSRWARAGGAHAPEQHRSEALARAEALEADRAARLAAIASPDPYGFSAPMEVQSDD